MENIFFTLHEQREFFITMHMQPKIYLVYPNNSPVKAETGSTGKNLHRLENVMVRAKLRKKLTTRRKKRLPRFQSQTTRRTRG